MKTHHETNTYRSSRDIAETWGGGPGSGFEDWWEENKVAFCLTLNESGSFNIPGIGSQLKSEPEMRQPQPAAFLSLLAVNFQSSLYSISIHFP